MKNLIPIILLLLGFKGIAQTVETKSDALVYKLDEKFEITFEADFIPDSTSIPNFDGFKIFQGPTKFKSISRINDDTIYIYRLSYTLVSTGPGDREIECPKFFFENAMVKAEPIKLKILDQRMTKKEIIEKEIKEFSQNQRLPNGTTQIIFTDKYGLIREYYENNWTIKRRLTSKEVRRLKRLNKET